MKENKIISKSDQVIGFVSSCYLAMAYLVGIIIFIVVLRYTEITDVKEKVQILVDMKSMVFLTNIMMYVLFGPVLILFILSLKKNLNNSSSILIHFSSIIGFIWAGSLTASGMISNGSIEPIIQLFKSDPMQAVIMWQFIDAVSMGIGNGNGEILGGLMTLGFGLAMVKNTKYSKSFGIYGIIVGVIGILSVIPILVNLAGVIGILQLIWFLIIGFSYLRLNK